MRPDLLRKIAVTYELCAGRTLSEPAAEAVADILDRYQPEALSRALDLCVKECRGAMSPADIITRVEQMDGRPAPDEAWGLIPKDEERSVCWTSEMCSAFEACRHLIDSDHVAARMAFLSAYRSAVQEARSENRPVKWSLSLGHNPAEREDCAARAVLEGKISKGRALMLCPCLDESRLLEAKPAQQLSRTNEPTSIKGELSRVMREIG